MRYVFFLMMAILCFYALRLSSVNDALYKDFDLIFIGPMDVQVGWAIGIAIILSFVIGFILAGLGWLLESKKRRTAEKDIIGLKAKLDKVEREREFQAKKMLLLEDTMKRPTEKKESPPPSKQRKTFLGIPIK